MTLAEALQNATDRLGAVAQLMTSIRDQVAGQLASTLARIEQRITEFNARPVQVVFYVDPINGSDVNDGMTIAKAKKSLDAVLAPLGSQGALIILLGNDTIKLRHNLNTFVSIQAAQVSATAPGGFVNASRVIDFLPQAQNSPSLTLGNMSAGMFFGTGALTVTGVTWNLPDVPAGYEQRPHISSSGHLNVLLGGGTIVSSGAGASALFGSFNGGRIVATLSGVVLSSNAPGHVFAGIAAGADPNASWLFASNIKSA